MNILNILFGVAIGGIVFLLFREVVMWYWKINESISNQQKTNSLLEEQNELLKDNNELLKQFIDDFSNN